MKTCPYHDYYISQAGNGVIYRGRIYQRGHGIGNLFKNIFSTIFPLIKSGLKTFGKETLKGTAHVLNDIIVEDSAPKESIKNRISEVGENLKNKAINKLHRMVGGSKSIKRKKTLKSSQIAKRQRKSKTLKTSRDIFS